MCIAEPDGGDKEKSIMAGGIGEAQRQEGFQQAECQADVQVKERSRQRTGRCGSGRVGPDSRISKAWLSSFSLTSHPMSMQTQVGSSCAAMLALPRFPRHLLFIQVLASQTPELIHPIECWSLPLLCHSLSHGSALCCS